MEVGNDVELLGVAKLSPDIGIRDSHADVAGLVWSDGLDVDERCSALRHQSHLYSLRKLRRGHGLDAAQK